MSDRFTALKLAWIDQITRDPGLGHFAARVGVLIASHLNRETGEAFPGQERLADLCGATERGVRKAIGELADRHHLLVEVSAGRGRVCRYQPIIHTEKRNRGSSFDAPKSGTVVPVIEPEKRNECAAKSGTVVPTNLLKEPIEDKRPEKPVCVSRTHTRSFRDDEEALEYVAGLIKSAQADADPRTVLYACKSHHGEAWEAKLHTWTLGAIARAAMTPQAPKPIYDGPADLRRDLVDRGGEALATFLDHYCQWRDEDRTLLCRNAYVADRLVKGMGQDWLDRRAISVGLMAANDTQPTLRKGHAQ